MGLVAQENARPERINGTIKGTFMDHWKTANVTQLRKQVRQAVNYYNNHRPDNHLERMSPLQFSQGFLEGRPSPQKTLTIFNHQLVNQSGQR